MRSALRPLLIGLLFAPPVALLAACGGDDAADRPTNAYSRFTDGKEYAKSGSARVVDGDPVIVSWTAHGKAQNGKPVELVLQRLGKDCQGSASCSGIAVAKIGDPQRIALPSDGSEKSGEVDLGVVAPGNEMRLSGRLCSGDACWGAGLRTYRRPLSKS